MKIKNYLTPDGHDLFSVFLKKVRDPIAKAKIAMRVNRMSAGNFGDCKPLREGIWEIRIDQGSGYRVYYSLVNKQIILLLLGGDKRTQSADIDHAVACLQDYLKR